MSFDSATMTEAEPLLNTGKVQPGSWLPSSTGIHLAVWFAGVKLGIGVFRSGFDSYHMNMYLTMYAMSAASVAWVHSIFAIWNPINDLIGAWLSDSWAAKHSGARCGYIWPQIVIWPVFCVAPFMPQFVTYMGATAMALGALCAEDTLFSFVLIALGGIWTDITSGESERVKIARLEKLLELLSLPFVSMNYRHWTQAEEAGDPELFVAYYRKWALVAMIFSLFCLWQLSYLEEAGLRRRGAPSASAERGLGLVEFLHGLLRHKNLWCFIAMNVLNEMQGKFNGEFAAIFADINLRNEMSMEWRARYLTFEHTLVIVMGLLFTFVAQAYGVYAVYLYTLWAKFMVGVMLLPLAPNGYVGAAYHLLSVLCTSTAMGFFIVAVGNLVDEYRYMRIRNSLPAGASVVGLFWGLHALISKPMGSIGPVVGSYVLESAGWTGDAMLGPVTDEAKLAGYRLVIGFPVACGIIQLVAWHLYDLHGEKLRHIQAEIGSLSG